MGCDFPLLINAFGSWRRAELALGSSFETIAARIASLAKPQPPRSLGEEIADLLDSRVQAAVRGSLPLPDAVRRMESWLIDLPFNSPLLIPPMLVEIH